MPVEVRDVSSYEQLERWTEVRNATFVEDPQEVQRAAFLRAQEVDRLDLLAYVDDEPVGTALLAGDPLSAMSSEPYVEFGVLTDHRGRGVGSALLTELSRRARLLGNAGLTTECDTSDVDTSSYLTRHGFVEIERWRRALDLDRLGPAEPHPPGIELVWLSDRPDLLLADARGPARLPWTGNRPGDPARAGPRLAGRRLPPVHELEAHRGRVRAAGRARVQADDRDRGLPALVRRVAAVMSGSRARGDQ
jgi:GNAT superfamily N-acetyltransferase